MNLSLNIPTEAERTLREAWGAGLGQAAFEALLVEGYRLGKFGSATIRLLLGHTSRWDTERWLAERGIPLGYTLEDLEDDRRALAKLFAKSA